MNGSGFDHGIYMFDGQTLSPVGRAALECVGLGACGLSPRGDGLGTRQGEGPKAGSATR